LLSGKKSKRVFIESLKACFHHSFLEKSVCFSFSNNGASIISKVNIFQSIIINGVSFLYFIIEIFFQSIVSFLIELLYFFKISNIFSASSQAVSKSFFNESFFICSEL
jgi:hypothetical protein